MAVPVVYMVTTVAIFFKIALAVCGNLEKGLTSFLTESSSRFKMGGSLPFAYDDPSNSEVKFKQMLIEALGCGSIENARSQLCARCVPLISAYEFILDRLTADEPRYNILCVVHYSSNCIYFSCKGSCVGVSYYLVLHADSPTVELDVMDELLKKAVSAFPVVLFVVKTESGRHGCGGSL